MRLAVELHHGVGEYGALLRPHGHARRSPHKDEAREQN